MKASVPVLLAVDEDPQSLSAVERELVDRYARSYRVVCVSSAEEAMAELEALAAAGEDVALVLAAQWLSGTTGSELLGRVRDAPPARAARAADRVGQLGRRPDRRGDLRRRWRGGRSSTT